MLRGKLFKTNGCILTTGVLGPKSTRDFRETGPKHYKRELRKQDTLSPSTDEVKWEKKG